jgi:hypothetical protein
MSQINIPPIDPLLSQGGEQDDEETFAVEGVIISSAKEARLQVELWHFRKLCDVEAQKLKLIYLASYRPFQNDNRNAMSIIRHGIIENRESLDSLSSSSLSGKIKVYLINRMKLLCRHISGIAF